MDFTLSSEQARWQRIARDFASDVIKPTAADAAFEACRLATEVLGGAAIMHEHPVEKFLRDSVSFIHSDGTKQICLLRAAQSLSGCSSQPLFGF